MAVAALPLVVVASKIKLTANWKLLAALICPFALKLPLARVVPSSFAGMAVSLRLFAFQLNRIFSGDDDPSGNGRWERALRLFNERVSGGAGAAALARYSVETLSMESFMSL